MSINYIFDQVFAELPQIEDEQERIDNAIDYINNLSNVELLELIDRANPHE